MNTSKKIKLIIFDFYGIITFGSYRDIARWIAKKYKLKFDDVYEKLYHQCFTPAGEAKITERQMWAKIIKVLDLKENWVELKRRHINYLILNKVMLNYAISLQDRGYKVVFLSKNTPAQMKEVLDKYKIKKYIKNIINTYDLRLPKASPKTTKVIMKKFKVKPSEMIMSDDQAFNFTGAKKLGIKTVLYKNDLQYTKAIEKLLK